jgi:hypothetical protein
MKIIKCKSCDKRVINIPIESNNQDNDVIGTDMISMIFKMKML